MTGIGMGLSVLGIVVSIIGVAYVYNSFSKLWRLCIHRDEICMAGHSAGADKAA